MKQLALVIFALAFLTHVYAQWQQTKGPKGITVNVIYETGNVLFAGTAGKGIYKSVDNGITWTSFSRGIENTIVNAIIMTGNNLLIGAESKCAGVTDVYKSTDNGITWTKTKGLANGIVNSFAIKDSFVYAGVSTASSGVYRSPDNGNTWKKVNAPIDNGDKLFINRNVIIVSEDNFIWRSIDNGSTWDITEQFNFSGVSDFAAIGKTIFAASISGLEISYNNGKSWTYNNIAGGAFSLTEKNNILFLGSTNKVYKSLDTGRTWIEENNGLGKGSINALLYDGINLFAATPVDSSGIYTSSNQGQVWHASANGFAPASTVRCTISLGEYVFAGMQADGIYRTANNGKSWIKVGLNDDTLGNALVESFCVHNGIIFAGTSNGVYRSFDSGISFTRVVKGFPVNKGTVYIPSLTVSDGNIVAAASIVGTGSRIDAIYFSSNDGIGWKQSDFPDKSLGISSVASDGSAVVFAGSAGANLSTNGLYKSLDGGKTWKSKTLDFNADIERIAVQGQHVLASNLFSAFFSNNGGKIWVSSSPHGGGIFTYTIKDSTVYAGNQEGMFYSNNFGVTWQDLNNGFPECPRPNIEASCINNQFLFAGTFLNAVWKFKEPLVNNAISSIKIQQPQNSSFYLTANPNPFITATNISYGLPQGVKAAKIIITDYAGKMIKQFNIFGTKGTVSFGADGISDGTYFYALYANGEVISRNKLILIK